MDSERRRRSACLLVLLGIGLDVAAQDVDFRGRPIERFEYSSVTQLAELAERLDYTQATWMAGIREVPRLFLTDVPPRWRDSVSAEVSIEIKKRLFFRVGAPLALRANELILQDRARAESQRDRLDTDADFRAWIGGVAARYGVLDDAGAPLDAQAYDALLERLDIVPVSLALAQSAEDSGWGTSRFAAEGNALFGQWSWDENAMRPEQQRAELGNYGIASFETPLESFRAYMHNLNTHAAYAEMRARRAEMRSAGEPISGWELAETLVRYSERGAEYVEGLHTIMRVNRLAAADDARFGDGPTIYLVPVGDGSE